MRSALWIGSISLIVVGAFACSSSDAAKPAPEESELSNVESKEAPTEPPPASEGSYGTPTEEEEPALEGKDAGSGTGTGTGGGKGDGGGNGGGTGGGNGGGCDTNESEGNDDGANADAFAVMMGSKKTFCGAVNAGEVDFVTFTLPADARSLEMSLSLSAAGVTVEPTVDGQAFPFNGNYIVKPGGKYVLKVSGTAKSNYKIGVLPKAQ